MVSSNSGFAANRNWYLDLLIISILLGVFYFLWIGSYALFTPDEGRYSEVAREMVTTGDFITPRLNGVVFLDKPILYYWLQASAIKLFGIKEWALRLWPALIGILGALVTYTTGRILFNRRTGFLSAGILATCPLYYGAAHYANLDLEVAVFVASSLMCFIGAVKTQCSRLFIAAYVFAGLAALTKGLIGIAFPMMIIGSWILLLNRWSILKKMHLVLGLFIFAVISVPWYILAQKATPAFFEFFFLKQQISRFLTHDYFNNQTVAWFYAPIVIAGSAPWCVFIFQSLGTHLKNIWRNRQENNAELFIILWLVIVFTFFSIPKSKTIGYILPIFPALALLIGSYLDKVLDAKKSWGFWGGILVFMVVCAISPVFYFLFPKLVVPEDLILLPYIKLGTLLFFISSLITFYLLIKNKVHQQIGVLFGTALIFSLILISSCGDVNQKTVKPLTTQLKSILKPEDEVMTYFRYYQDLPIYLERRITIVADWTAPDIALNDNWARELWYGMSFQDTKDWLINEETFWQRWNSNKRVFVFTDSDYYSNMKCRSKGPIYQVGQYNQIVLLSNLRH